MDEELVGSDGGIWINNLVEEVMNNKEKYGIPEDLDSDDVEDFFWDEGLLSVDENTGVSLIESSDNLKIGQLIINSILEASGISEAFTYGG